jgi:hypothetical protein
VKRHLIFACELLCLAATLLLAGLWVNNPTGNYEPYIALSTVGLGLLEFARRQSKVVSATQGHSADAASPSPITVEEIVDTINSAPPFQRAELSKQYNGVTVKWIGYLHQVENDFSALPGHVRVRANVDNERVIGHSFLFSESVTRFPQVRTLKRNTRIEVLGTIVGASGEGLYVALKPITITVLEEDE